MKHTPRPSGQPCAGHILFCSQGILVLISWDPKDCKIMEKVPSSGNLPFFIGNVLGANGSQFFAQPSILWRT